LRQACTCLRGVRDEEDAEEVAANAADYEDKAEAQPSARSLNLCGPEKAFNSILWDQNEAFGNVWWLLREPDENWKKVLSPKCRNGG
jgi:hypothetical protein